LENDIVVQDIGDAAEWILAQFWTSCRSREVRDAARIIRRGGTVAFPTETVYGLGADAFNPTAVARVFEIKGRPRFDPLIVHVSDERQAQSLTKGCPAEARALVERFLPGPLSLVLAKVETVPGIVTAGLPTVAVRMPDHPLALELLWEAGVWLAAPSVNLFGRTSPTTAAHVADQLGNRVGKILDGGPCRVRLESAIVSFSERVLLRPGGVPIEDIKEVIGQLGIPDHVDRMPLPPGRLPQHYASYTPLTLSPEIALPPASKRVGLQSLQRPTSQEGFATVEVTDEAIDTDLTGAPDGHDDRRGSAPCEAIGLKCPNDLVVGHRKAAGLLCERLQRVDLVGVGVNVNAGSRESPAQLRKRITSLRELTGTVWDLTDVVSEVSQEVSRMLALASEKAVAEMLREYSLHHWQTRKNIELVDTDRAPRIAGRCVGIDCRGRLLVKTEQGSRALLTGSILSVHDPGDAHHDVLAPR
jgi:L-threonylcarbamoyladenylate synthase